MALLIVLSVSAQAGYREDLEANYENGERARNQIPVPVLNYFPERKMVKEWNERWNRPGAMSYVYLLQDGKFIGYFMAKGKPSSTRSYLVPETENEVKYNGNGVYADRQLMDLDGTYGENNVGIRFFTMDGTAVEWGGVGATYIFSDKPLPLPDIQKLFKE